MTYLLSLIFLFSAQLKDDLVPPPIGKTSVTKKKTATPKTPGKTEKTEKKSSQPEEEGELEEFDDGSEPEIEESTLWDWIDRVSQTGPLGLLFRGGAFMWPILIMGIIAVGVIIERYRSLKMLDSDSSRIRAEVRALLQEDRPEEALELCDQEQGPVPAILAAGVRKFLLLRRLDYDPAKIEEQVIKAMEDYSVHVVSALEKHLPILATISSVSPMLGFLGTVAGMITSFDEIVAKMGETNIVMSAAGGISVALLTTAFGLIVGIPAFISYNYFSSVINRFVLEVEESATELIEIVTLHLALERHETGGQPL
jgi:biopolymer transport protein ExbB